MSSSRVEYLKGKGILCHDLKPIKIALFVQYCIVPNSPSTKHIAAYWRTLRQHPTFRPSWIPSRLFIHGKCCATDSVPAI